MADIVLILGNGFDLDLGLKTKYSDFAQSEEWDELYYQKRQQYFRNALRTKFSLLDHINRHRVDAWFDLEEEIKTFVIEQSKLERNGDAINFNHKDFKSLKDSLKEYLIRISAEYNTDTSRLAFTLLHVLLSNTKCRKHIFTFNYTDCLKLCRFNGIPKELLEYTHIHESLNGDIVLGCEVYDVNRINRDYSFLYKYNSLKKPNKIVKNLLEAKEVIFFGHSINEMDFCYFREYFKNISSKEGNNKNLTIICKDEKSAINVRNNIRNQGIIVTDLYNNLNELDFIHTDLVYANDDNEMKKLNDYLDRIKRFTATQGIKVH